MIHYDLLMRALDYYQRDCDYKYIEVPWFVEPSTDAITRPDVAKPCLFNNKAFVGSAEQSFLQLVIDGRLSPNTNYVSLTPCVRDEKYDETHHIGFMKIELFHYYEDKQDFSQLNTDWQIILDNMVKDSFDFFSQYANSNLEIVQLNNDNYDINNNQIEIGSYSVKNKEINGKDILWICGTGLAEPRFSYSLGKYKI